MRERISRDLLLMAVAKLQALRSTCRRGQNGAVIAKDSRIISTGYNGPYSGATECSSSCDINSPCKRSIHAEVNAIYFASRMGISTKGCKLYCTSSPCINCARAIIQAGIIEVIYLDQFRDRSGIDELWGANIITRRISERQSITI